MLKSAIQKIIRLRVKNLILPSGTSVDAEMVLKCCIRQLCHKDQPSQFNPDIGASVRAITSCAKRLGVIHLEDASYDSERSQCLFAAALLSHRNPSWRPSKNLIKTWERWAVDMLNSTSATIWKSECTRKPFTIKNSDTSAKRSSLLLDALRSLSGDHIMYRSTASGTYRIIDELNGSNALTQSTPPPRELCVSFPDVAIDQHTHPTIALSLKWIAPITKIDKRRINVTPFSLTLSQIFSEFTGRNPRKSGERTNDPKTLYTNAQKYCRQVVMNTLPIRRNSIDDTKLQGNLGQLSFVIPKSYIAGAIGHIELRGIQGIDENTSRKIKKNVFVTVEMI
jgi:hypothetical protein